MKRKWYVFEYTVEKEAMIPSKKRIFAKLPHIIVIREVRLSTVYTVFNPFPNKHWFLRVCSICLLKTLREKEKLLATSNFSFSHSVFYLFRKLSAIFIKLKNCRLQTLPVWKSLKFGKGLNHISRHM